MTPTDCSPPGSSVHGDSPGKNTGVGFHSLLQGIFATQGSNLGLPQCRQILYHLSHQGSPLGIVVTRLSEPLSVESLCAEGKQECWILQSSGSSQAGAMQTRWKEGSWGCFREDTSLVISQAPTLCLLAPSLSLRAPVFTSLSHSPVFLRFWILRT